MIKKKTIAINPNKTIETGLYKGYTPLGLAALQNNIKAIELLLKAGAQIDTLMQSGYDKGNSPLKIALLESKTEAINLLSIKKAAITPDILLESLLIQEEKKGSGDNEYRWGTEFLEKANENTVNSVLNWALNNKRFEIVNMLLEKVDNINQETLNILAALTNNTEEEKVKIMMFLLIIINGNKFQSEVKNNNPYEQIFRIMKQLIKKPENEINVPDNEIAREIVLRYRPPPKCIKTWQSTFYNI